MTDEKKYLIEHLGKTHNRQAFDCGVDSLNAYLKNQASQDMKKNVSVTHVLTESNGNDVLGFYTLSTIGIEPGELPGDTQKKLPRYPILPGVLLGRLAVNHNYIGNGLGTYLLIDGLKRTFAISNEVGIVAVIVDAKNEEAAEFYKKFDFIAFPGNKLKLFLPINVIRQLDL